MNAFETRYRDLCELWKEYKPIIENELKGVVERNFVYSSFTESDNIVLIVGINPSFRKGDNNLKSHSFRFKDVLDDPYYRKIKNVLPESKEINYEYTDLFYLRQTEQIGLKDFLKYSTGIEFMVKQLCITQDMIEKIKPSLIIVFNKYSWNFWGKNYNCKNDNNVWMGYDFDFDSRKNLHYIKGLIDSKERICGNREDTNLKGTPIYFSKFLKYLPNHEILRIKKEMNLIIDEL